MRRATLKHVYRRIITLSEQEKMDGLNNESKL
jgi:hypothetical protein